MTVRSTHILRCVRGFFFPLCIRFIFQCQSPINRSNANLFALDSDSERRIVKQNEGKKENR